VKLYCYEIPPIDFWFGALTGRQLIENAWENYGEEWETIAAVCKQVAALKSQAEAAFKTINWEGDIREGPYYFALPGDTDLSIGYIVKQENNGNCFVASPEPLPFLEGQAFEKTEIG
jgi:hypothetical protein